MVKKTQAQYSAVQPDNFGAIWNFKLNITPVIPALIKSKLLEF